MDDPKTQTEHKGRGKTRDENLKDVILTAAANLLLELGYKHFTIEGVAARAKASKVTIYKWWPSKGALALDGYVRIVTPVIAFPQSESPFQDIENQLCEVIRTLTSTQAGQAMLELIGAAQGDPILKQELTDRYIQPRREIAGLAFARLLKWDPVEKREELYAITDQVYGAIYNRILFGLMPTDRGFARQLLSFWAPKPWEPN